MSLSRHILDICESIDPLCEIRKELYFPMANKFLPPEDQWGNWKGNAVEKARDGFMSEIDWAIKNLKRRDRIDWFLRYAQFYYWNKLVPNGDERYKAKFKSFVKAMQDKYNFPVPGDRYGTHFYQYIQEHLEDLKQVFAFFLGMHIPEFDKHIFTNDSFMLFKEWKETADNYQAQKKGISRSEEEADHKVDDFITFPNGWKWVLKHTPSCSLEGNAMNHCGNHCESMKPDDELLSLREPTDDSNVWEPHLTVALNHGVLRDMVGKSNAEPSQKYQKYIKALVNDSRIKDWEGKPEWAED